MSGQAIFFGPESEPLFGWLHGLDNMQHDVGIVLCSPWGREEVSAHHSLRQWALRLAQAGWPCIRFDYAGEGDSSGDSLSHGGLDAWVQSVTLAVDELKQRAGVSQVCLMGIRVGAAAAALASQGRSDVLGLIAVAPVVKGRGFVRELTALHAASNRRPEHKAPADVFQSGGYAMSMPARDQLSAMDISQLPLMPAAHVLVLDRDDMPANQAWVKSLQEAGADVRQQSLGGYVGMMADPHHAVAPQAMIEASLTWLDEVIRPVSKAVIPSRQLADAVAQAGLHQAKITVEGMPGSVVREQAFVVPGVPAFGILTTNVSDAVRSGHAVLLLNAGSTRRIGPSRIAVWKARRWAAQGHVVLRMDLAGVGDSDVREGRPLNMSYPHEAMLDVRAAFDYLSEVVGAKHVHACGLCSGAYHALKAARDGLPFTSITLINPLVYFNAEGLSLDDAQILTPQKVHSAAASYKASAGSLDKWLKLFKGQVKVDVLIKVFMKRLGMAAGVKVRDLARVLHWPLKDDLGTELRRLNTHGMHVQFVFAQGDPGLIMLREGAGNMLGTLQRKGLLSVRVFDQADHVFTDIGLRRDMLSHLDHLVNDLTSACRREKAVPARPLSTLSS